MPSARMESLLKWRPFHHGVVFGATTLAAVLMGSVFSFYYVKVFQEHYRVSPSQFQISQLVYMIWSAASDPLLGYCQDNCKVGIVRSRRHTILYGAPLFALSFLVPWFPWKEYTQNDWVCGLHLTVALCFWDTFFTHCLLAHGCLMAELVGTHKERAIIYRYSVIASIIGSISVYYCETISNHLSDFHAFQCCCIAVAIVAWLCMCYTGMTAVTRYELLQMEIDDANEAGDSMLATGNTRSPSDNQFADRSSQYSIFRLTWQILSNLNFLWFVLCNLLNEFHNNYQSNMSNIVADAVIPRSDAPAWAWNVFYGSLVLLPKLMQLAMSPILSTHGYYNMCRFFQCCKPVAGCLMMLVGKQHTWMFMTFMIFDSIITRTSFSLMWFSMPDIIEEDLKIYNRKHPISSMVLGTNALVCKPGISLAPMLAIHVLNQNGYEQYKAKSLTGPGLTQLQDTMFYLSCLVPVCVGVLQTVLWSFYKPIARTK